MPYVLVLYYSRHGSVASLAQQIASGVEADGAFSALIRTVPPVSAEYNQHAEDIPDKGPLYCTLDDFRNASALALGSPGRFGNMSAALKHFLEQTTASWVSGHMVGKPATVFTSTTTPHGGQESTLLSMMNPLMHHGMLLTGVPFTEQALHSSVSGGTPYGVSHIAGENHAPLQPDIEQLAFNQGRRLSDYAKRLL